MYRQVRSRKPLSETLTDSDYFRSSTEETNTMSGLEPMALALAGPMGKLAWAGVKKCWVKYRKDKAKGGREVNDTNEVVRGELDKNGRNIGELYDKYANRLGARFVQGDCECPSILLVAGRVTATLLLTFVTR
jgi:hypothetical protein